MTRLSVVASLLLVASVGAVELIARSADELGSLFTRQSTILDPADIPSACQSQCTGIVSALNQTRLPCKPRVKAFLTVSAIPAGSIPGIDCPPFQKTSSPVAAELSPP
ncbi:hypothetical protein EYR36_001925 [Pleurotus pulmonarius]|nr:hypothetical protein EYR36_001925 [Pleurotus pulmonarius]